MNVRLFAQLSLFCCFLPLLADLKNAQHMTLDDLGIHLIAQDGRDPRRKQVRSLDQTSVHQMVGIENASSACGDFALNNILLITQALKNPNSKDTYLGLLTSADTAAKLFGVPSSPWNSAVLKERFRSRAREIFQKQVLGQVHTPQTTMEYSLGKGNQETVDRFNYLVAVVESLDPRELYYPEVWEDGLRYRAQKNAVYAAIIERMKAIAKNGSSKTSRRDIFTSNELDLFIAENVLVDFTIGFDGTLSSSLPDYGINLAKKKIDCVPGGRWIQTSEMPHLIQSIKHSSPEVFNDIILDTYGGDIADDYEHAFATEGISNLYKTLRTSKSDCIGGILIYVSSAPSFKNKAQGLLNSFGSWLSSCFSSSKKTSYKSDFEAQGVRDNGHWIAFVVARLKGSTNYYIADSLSNCNRLRDPLVNDLIAIFDGKKELPGYEITQKELACKQYTTTSSFKSSYLSLLVGTGITSALGYYVYSYFKSAKKNDEDTKEKK